MYFEQKPVPMNYDDAERRAYVKADPTAALLARIADLEHERDELRAELEMAREEGYRQGREDAEAEHE